MSRFGLQQKYGSTAAALSPGSAGALGHGPEAFDETAGHDELRAGGDQSGVQGGGELKDIFGDEGHLVDCSGQAAVIGQ